MLWDLQAFFDNVQWPALLTETKALAYPARVLQLSLQVHAGPRVLASNGVQSQSLLYPKSGVLPGLVDSIALTRALLMRPALRVQEQNPSTQISTHVDDVTQLTIYEGKVDKACSLAGWGCQTLGTRDGRPRQYHLTQIGSGSNKPSSSKASGIQASGGRWTNIEGKNLRQIFWA